MRDFSASTELQAVECARAGVLKLECAEEHLEGLLGCRFPGPTFESHTVGLEWV